MKRILLSLLLVDPLLGQVAYSVSKTTVLSGAAEVITIQQPDTGGKTVRFISAYMDSSAACPITIERNGAAATTLGLTINPVNPVISPNIAATAFSGSDVGVGTIITRANVNGGLVVDLSRVVIFGSGTTKNLTLRTGTCTATVNIVITFTEGGNI